MMLKSVASTDLSTKGTTMRGSSWRSISLMFIVACTLAWFRADKGLYALIERAMAYCWLRYWDKKRYNQTAIPFSFTFPIKWERVSCLRFKRKCLFYIHLKKLAHMQGVLISNLYPLFTIKSVMLAITTLYFFVIYNNWCVFIRV